ncbi:hypothetical protein LCGC14_1594100, partial [marine sediment metagenome]
MDYKNLSFNAGEFSPRLDGRDDLEKYYSACRVLLNMICTRFGPAERRPGLQFVSKVKDSTKKTRLLSFKHSTTQAYILETGDQYFRFYKDRGQILTLVGSEDLATALAAKRVAHWKLNDSAASTAVDDAVASVPHDGVASSNTEDLSETGKVGTGCFNLNGISYVGVTDHAALSFGNNTVDSAMSVAATVFVTPAAGHAAILTKWDNPNKREWWFGLDADNKLLFQVVDESANAAPKRLSDVAIATGWHTLSATYAGQSAAGATAMDLVTLYVDGLEIASTATNDASYDAMENDTADLLIGAHFLSGVQSRMWSDKI